MVTRRALSAAVVVALAASAWACVSVDPGDNFVVPNTTFDPDYFYCHVEPQYIVAYKCGPGDPSKGDPANSCHYSSAVSGMALVQHAPINCNGGDHPVDLTQITSVAQGDYEAVSLEMNSDYTTAPLYVRPQGNNHPRAVIQSSDLKVVDPLLSAWASL